MNDKDWEDACRVEFELSFPDVMECKSMVYIGYLAAKEHDREETAEYQEIYKNNQAEISRLCDVVIDLDSEVIKLKAELKRERACVDYYTNGEILDDLIEMEDEFDEDNAPVFRIGKLARQTQTQRTIKTESEE